METKKDSSISLPGAVIIAGALIAVAVIWTSKPAVAPSIPAETNTENNTAESTDAAPISPVTSKDYILGNPNAIIKIVEYSDPSCPYCKIFNSTMVEIMDEYGPDGKVAWIYRSFPLYKPTSDGRILHPKAGKESEAFECAADQGGNKAFWDYQKLFYARTPAVTSQSPEGFDSAKLPDLAEEVGLNKADFKQCLDSNKMATKVEQSYNEAVEAGINMKGTPYSVIISKDKSVPILGAQPYANVKQVIDVLLTN